MNLREKLEYLMARDNITKKADKHICIVVNTSSAFVSQTNERRDNITFTKNNILLTLPNAADTLYN